MSKDSARVIICGGGNGAHVLAGVISGGANNIVTVLDVYEDEMERWKEATQQSGFRVCFPDKTELYQKPEERKFTVTREVKVIAEADVVILCLPAYGHQVYFDIITPYLQDSCLVVGMPGHPGFEYQALHYLSQKSKGCLVMSLETLPWACRISKYGSEVIVQGTKETVMASLMLREKDANKTEVVKKVQNLLGGKPVLKLVDHFLELTMHTKASLHPPIMYSRWRNWDGKPLDAPPLFYQGIDEEAAKYLNAVSDETLEIAKAVAKVCPKVDVSQIGTLHQWLLDHYTGQIKDKSSLLTSMKTNEAYAGLVHPMKKTADGNKYVPNFEYRYTREDIPYGLVVFRGIANMVNVRTPVIDEIISWAQKMLDKEFLVDGKLVGKDISTTRLPQNFGLTSLDDLLALC